MQTVYVQWTDATKTGILSVFSCQQDSGEYPYQDAVPSDDSRYAAWYGELPQMMKLTGGLIVPGT